MPRGTLQVQSASSGLALGRTVVRQTARIVVLVPAHIVVVPAHIVVVHMPVLVEP